MGFFKNLVSKLSRKQPDVAKQIARENESRSAAAEADKKRYETGLSASSQTLGTILDRMAAKHRVVDEAMLDEIKASLIAFDVGHAVADRLVRELRDELKFQRIDDPALVRELLLDKLMVAYINNASASTSLNILPGRMNVLVVVGVNGVGKTTTIAKLAKTFVDQGKSVMIVAADTFRAGAVAQLDVWAQRVGAAITKPDRDGQDPASVVFSGLQRAAETRCDVVICDTAGRLQNKTNLMNELKKMRSVVTRFAPGAPHETLLVLDASTGQSGLDQAMGFAEAASPTGIVMTKMDGTSKGGIILAVKEVLNLPVKLVGFGEGLADLRPFDLELFVDGLAKAAATGASPTL